MTITALITGGTSGIGRAAAKKLAQLGVHVLVAGRSAERGEKTIAEIRTAGGQADFIPSDLRDASSAQDSALHSATGRSAADLLSPNAKT
jgi:NAD(P)-dependent dehydrogenase (short-subunit alcohol dehydrogenase family)